MPKYRCDVEFRVYGYVIIDADDEIEAEEQAENLGLDEVQITEEEFDSVDVFGTVEDYEKAVRAARKANRAVDKD